MLSLAQMHSGREQEQDHDEKEAAELSPGANKVVIKNAKLGLGCWRTWPTSLTCIRRSLTGANYSVEVFGEKSVKEVAR